MPRGVYKRKKQKAAKDTKPKRRKYRMETVVEPFEVTDEIVKDTIAGEEFRKNFNVIKWINEADTPKERQLRKSAMHAMMYSGGNWFDDEGGLLKAATQIRDRMAEKEAKDKAMAGEGIETVRWPVKEAFNPDSMFVKPPLHDNPISPAHYQRHPSGVQCITITEQFNFNRGNAIKYIWRADEKGSTLENLRKAYWYLGREIERLEKEAVK